MILKYVQYYESVSLALQEIALQWEKWTWGLVKMYSQLHSRMVYKNRRLHLHFFYKQPETGLSLKSC